MSSRAREFLDRWELEHLGVVPEDRKLRELIQLAVSCRKDAVAAGISAEELRTAAAQDLIRDMLAAIATANRSDASAGEATGQIGGVA